MKESFVFYRSFIDAIKTLPEKDQLILFHAISEFALDQKEPELEGTVKGFWMLIKPNIEANNKRYENGKKGGEHGIKGGRPKKTETPKKPPKNPEQTPNEKNKTPDVDVDVDVDVNVDVNVNENGDVSQQKKRRFSPPSIDEIQNYFSEISKNRNQSFGIKTESEKFHSFYTSKGWFVGKNKMVDWKAAVRNWMKNVKTTNNAYSEYSPLINEKAI